MSPARRYVPANHRLRTRWATALAGLVLTASLAAVGCIPAGPTGSPTRVADEETYAVRGTVVRFEPPFAGANPGAAPRSVTVRSSGGVEVTVEVDEAPDARTWNLLHLNSHRLTGEPVVLVYRNRASALVAVDLRE